MTDFSKFFPGEPTLILRKFYPDPGTFDLTVPVGATIARLSASGCGGQGENHGGGGAFARSVVAVTAGESLRIQVGNTSTASTPGDSGVRRGASGPWLVYADRGRGNSNPGLASLSIGDVKRDGQRGYTGQPTQEGRPGLDEADYGSLGFEGRGVYRVISGATSYGHITGPGGGGFLTAYYDLEGIYVIGWASHGSAGCGQVALEFFDINPGY